MEKTCRSNRRTVWDMNPDRFCIPDYLEFEKDLKDQFRYLRKVDISKKDLMEAWEKCGVIGINFTSDSWRMGRSWATIEGFQNHPGTIFDRETGVPKAWKDRYGTDVGYWIEFLKMEPSEIRQCVKQLAKESPEGWGIKITPKEFYRALFFHEVAHTLPICGYYANELVAMPKEERLNFEREAWLWGVKMARRKNAKIRILCHSRKKEEGKLEHSNYSQWYQLLKRDEEFRKRQKAEVEVKKAA